MSKYTDSIYTTATVPLVGTELWLAVQPGTASGVSVQVLPNMILTTGGATGAFPVKNSSSNYDATWTTLNSLMAASTGISLAGTSTQTIALATATPLSVLGVAGAATTNPLPIAGAAAQVLRVNDGGTGVAFGAINLGSSAAITGTLPIANITYLGALPGLAVVANASSGSAAATSVVGSANQLLAINNAATTVLFRSISSLLDTAVNSTQGSILYRNAATWTFLGGGTNGQLLQTGGTAANPQWVGGMALLNTLSPSAVASTNDTTSFTSTYRNYMISFENVCPATNTTVLQLTIATTGTAWVSGGYFSSLSGFIGANGNLESDTSTTVILLSGLRSTTSVATTTNCGVSGFIYLNNPASSSILKQFNGNLSYQASNGALSTTTFGGVEVSGTFNSTAAIIGVNFAFSSGNIQTGTIKIYGIS